MIILRYASDDERHGAVRSAWLSCVLPRGKHSSGFFRAPYRGHEIGLHLARRALELAVDELLHAPMTRVVVAELDTLPGELLGWTAFDDESVHFVRVPSGYGRRGLGTVLLRRAGADKNPSYITGAGQALLDAVRSQAQVTHVG